MAWWVNFQIERQRIENVPVPDWRVVSGGGGFLGLHNLSYRFDSGSRVSL